MPEEISAAGQSAVYTGLVKKQTQAYHRFFAKLRDLVFQKNAELANDPKNHNLLEGWAKEDARYITPLATLGQLGMTINARNLEYLFRVFASQNLSEIKAIGKAMYLLVEKVAPSIILFVGANDFDQKTYPALHMFSSGLTPLGGSRGDCPAVALKDFTLDADTRVAAAILHRVSGQGYDQCQIQAKSMALAQKAELFKQSFSNMQFYDSVLREFEFAELTFELNISAACFAQLKRHRMLTITAQPYIPELGVEVPDAIREIGGEPEFNQLVLETNALYDKLFPQIGLAAQYVLTNAHRRRVLLKVNARELYHIARLREDAHAQWDIQRVAAAMSRLAEEKMPLVFGLLCGKDRYAERYRKLFGKSPKITP